MIMVRKGVRTNVLLANFLCDLDVCTIYDPTLINFLFLNDNNKRNRDLPTVPNNNPPFKQNFMFDVPEASVPAVEIC